MVLSEYIDNFFSNDQKEPSSINFPQGTQFIELQKGKMMRHQARANRLIDPNGYSPDHTLHGQRALGGISFNMDSNLKLVEGFNTASTMGGGSSKDSGIAQQNINDKKTRLRLAETAGKDAAAYQQSVQKLVSEAQNWQKKPQPPLETLAYVAQTVPNPDAASGSHSVWHGYIPFAISKLVGAPAEGKEGITCATTDPTTCIRKCQARTYDDAGVGFILNEDSDKKKFTCYPITKQADLTTIRQQLDATPQLTKKDIPGGNWQREQKPGTTAYIEGRVLHAQLRKEGEVYVEAQVLLPQKKDSRLKYSNNKGKFRQVLNGEDALAALDMTRAYANGGFGNFSLKMNLLQAKSNSYPSTTIITPVEAGDSVDIKNNKFVITHGQQPSVPTQSNLQLYDLSYDIFPHNSSPITSKSINQDLMGQLLYVDDTGAAPLDSTVKVNWQTKQYNSIGNYKTSAAGTSVKDEIECQKLCDTSPNGCRGYVFGKADTKNKKPATCYTMQTNDWPNHGGSRIWDENYQMMLRIPSVDKMPAGCPTDVLIESASNIPNPYNPTQLPTKGCGIGKILADNEKKIKTKNHQLENTQNNIKDEMYNLLNDDTTLQNKLSSNLDKMKGDLAEYQSINEKARSTSGKLTHADATSEDTKLQLISENYHYLIWSILAIALVIGGIRASRN